MIPAELLEDGQWAALKPAARSVLVVLAAHADPSGLCWPSRKKIAAQAGVDECSVSRAVRELIAAGLVRRVSPGGGRTDGGGYRATRYQLTLQQKRPRNSCTGATDKTASNGSASAIQRERQRHAPVAPAQSNGSASATRTSSWNTALNSHDDYGRRNSSGGALDDDDGGKLRADIPDDADNDRIVKAIQARWKNADQPGILTALRHPHTTPAIVRASITQVERAGGQGVGSLLKVIKAKADSAGKQASDRAAERQRDMATERDRIAAEIEAGKIGDDELRAVYSTADPDVVRADRALRGEAAKRIALRRCRSEAVPE